MTITSRFKKSLIVQCLKEDYKLDAAKIVEITKFDQSVVKVILTSKTILNWYIRSMSERKFARDYVKDYYDIPERIKAAIYVPKDSEIVQCLKYHFDMKIKDIADLIGRNIRFVLSKADELENGELAWNIGNKEAIIKFIELHILIHKKK